MGTESAWNEAPPWHCVEENGGLWGFSFTLWAVLPKVSVRLISRLVDVLRVWAPHWHRHCGMKTTQNPKVAPK